MYRSIFTLAVFCYLIALMTWGCDDSSSTGVAGVGMDLIPTEDPASLGKLGDYCSADEGELAVHVTNQGSEDILIPTVTAVIFNVGGGLGDALSMVTQELSAIAAGQTIVQTFAIPAACYSPDCEFEIILDYYDVLDESIQSNNSVNGVCIGDSGLEGSGELPM